VEGKRGKNEGRKEGFRIDIEGCEYVNICERAQMIDFECESYRGGQGRNEGRKDFELIPVWLSWEYL
jgi:hypothetical protein